MNIREFADGATTSLDDWQRAEIEKKDAVRLRIMLHGGDLAVSERLPDGRTKREQIREALDALPYVEEVVFALTPSFEADLFEACDGTIILIERNAAQRGARHELTLHAGQDDAVRKLFVFVPDGDRVPELEGDGFLASLVRDRVKPLHQSRYSDRDYGQCRLVRKARDFVEGLRIEAYEDIAALPPR